MEPFKALKGNIPLLRILYSAKIHFNNKDKTTNRMGEIFGDYISDKGLTYIGYIN